MRIAEIYRSRQGEGRLTGRDSVFVRTSGCNLRCWFCDTPYASWQPEGMDLAVDEIAARVLEWPAQHVVLTGGEPMLFAELVPLAERLRQGGRHITIETAGTLYLPVACDLMSISPKRANSDPSAERAGAWARRHAQLRAQPEVLRRLIEQYEYQLKFVIQDPADCEDVLDLLDSIPQIERQRVYLMPQGVTTAELAERAGWLEAYCAQHQLGFCPRMQIEWFGWTRGT